MLQVARRDVAALPCRARLAQDRPPCPSTATPSAHRLSACTCAGCSRWRCRRPPRSSAPCCCWSSTCDARAGRASRRSMPPRSAASGCWARWSSAWGLVFGIDPVATQAWGARQRRRYEGALGSGIAVALLTSVPIGALWLLTGPSLRLLGQEPAAHRRRRAVRAGAAARAAVPARLHRRQAVPAGAGQRAAGDVGDARRQRASTSGSTGCSSSAAAACRRWASSAPGSPPRSPTPSSPPRCCCGCAGAASPATGAAPGSADGGGASSPRCVGYGWPVATQLCSRCGPSSSRRCSPAASAPWRSPRTRRRSPSPRVTFTVPLRRLARRGGAGGQPDGRAGAAATLSVPPGWRWAPAPG